MGSSPPSSQVCPKVLTLFGRAALCQVPFLKMVDKHFLQLCGGIFADFGKPWEAQNEDFLGKWALKMLELSKKNRMHWTLGFKVNSDFTVKEQNLLGLKHNLNGQLAIKRLGNEHHFHVQFAVPGIWRRFSGCLVDFKLASMFVLLGPWEWILVGKIHEINISRYIIIPVSTGWWFGTLFIPSYWE